MIRHVYLIRLKDRSRAQECAEKIRSLRQHIPELHRVEVGLDFVGAPVSYDLIEICEFLTQHDFEVFTDHPYHAEIRKYIAAVKQDAVKVDYRPRRHTDTSRPVTDGCANPRCGRRLSCSAR